MKQDNLILAYYAASEMSYVPYDTSEISHDEVDRKNLILPSNKNPEKELIKKDFFKSLGEDALFIINLFYEAPLEVLTPITENITKTSILMFLKNKKWSARRIKLAFQEVTQYAAVLN